MMNLAIQRINKMNIFAYFQGTLSKSHSPHPATTTSAALKLGRLFCRRWTDGASIYNVYWRWGTDSGAAAAFLLRKQPIWHDWLWLFDLLAYLLYLQRESFSPKGDDLMMSRIIFSGTQGDGGGVTSRRWRWTSNPLKEEPIIIGCLLLLLLLLLFCYIRNMKCKSSTWCVEPFCALLV